MLFIIIILLSGSFFKYYTPSKAPLFIFIFGIILHYINNIKNTTINDSINFWQQIHSESILIYIIPPLIYYSSAHIDIHILRQYIKHLILLNIPILIISILLTSLVFSFLEENMKWTIVLLFSTIISATDPVSVISILDSMNMSKKIKTLIDGEALLNDAVVYLFYSLLILYEDKGINSDFVFKIFYIPFGSILLSCIIFFVFFNLLRRIYDSDIEIALTIVFCYGSFYLAEYIQLSGVFTIVIFGLWMSYLGKTTISPSIKKSLEHVWETLDTNMNFIIFSLSGLIGMKTINYFHSHWFKVFIMYLSINIIRLLSILLFSKFLIHKQYRIHIKQLILVGISNIKGAITIVLILKLGENTMFDKEQTNILLFYVYGIVFLSLLINPIFIYLFIKFGIRHEYDETLEYMLHIRGKLEKVGYDIKKSFYEDKTYLKNIKWSIVDDEIIKTKDISRSKINAIELDIHNDKYLEYRIIYLTSLKENLWKLFDQNQLYRDTIIILLEIIDSALDTQDKHWENCFKNYCSLPMYYKWVPNFYRKKILYHTINHKHNILSGYILAHKYTLDHLNTIFDIDCDILYELKLEMDKSILNAQTILNQIEDLYPNITQKIETKQAIFFILKNQQRFLKKIFKQGKINYYIYNHINQEINQKLHS